MPRYHVFVALSLLLTWMPAVAPIQAQHRERRLYATEFSDAEESVLKGRQGDSAEHIARALPGRSKHEVRRRCIELDLRCGDTGGGRALPKNSEKWRTGSNPNRRARRR